MKRATFGIVALLLVGLVAAGAYAMPFGGRGSGNEALKEALESGDYDAYLSAIDEGWQKFRGEMTEERFNSMVERHQDMAEHRAAMQENRDKIEQAMERGYEAWLEAIGELEHTPRMAEHIQTEEDFNTLVELHEARQNQDWKTAQDLAQELGLENAGRVGFGHSMRG